jgi:nucleolar protein 56
MLLYVSGFAWPMGYFRFSNILGTFVFDDRGELAAKGKLAADTFNAKDSSPELIAKILGHFRDRQYRKDFYKKNMELTGKSLRESVSTDWLVIQTVNTLQELDKVANSMSKRLREWYSLHNPEFSNDTPDNEKYVTMVSEQDIPTGQTSIGADLPERDIAPIRELARAIKGLYGLRKSEEEYLDVLMKELMPNVQAISGTMIGAKLMHQAGSLKHLSELPASTVQMLGAEKALFRHMQTGAKCPKYGILFQHQLVQKAKNKGKAARLLADKISIAAKVDYFKGEFVGDKLRREIEEKLK